MDISGFIMCVHRERRRHVWSITNIPYESFIYYPLQNLLSFCDVILKRFLLCNRQCRSPVLKYRFSAILITYASDELSLTSKPFLSPQWSIGSPCTKISISDIQCTLIHIVKQSYCNLRAFLFHCIKRIHCFNYFENPTNQYFTAVETTIFPLR